jgi:cytochrome c peroxidase
MRREIEELPPLAEEGYNLFMGKAKCGNCHLPPLFSGVSIHQPDQPLYFRVTSRKQEEFSHQRPTKPSGVDSNYEQFVAVPSVRNLAYTSPYFHNGSLFELVSCIEAHKDIYTMNPLSDKDKKALLAFMDTLNDSAAISAIKQIQLPETDGVLVPTNRRSGGVY